jgi:hypothetical protein
MSSTKIPRATKSMNVPYPHMLHGEQSELSEKYEIEVKV